MWSQIHDPLNNAVLSAGAASIPTVVLLGSLALFRIAVHYAALLGLTSALIIGIFVYGMPFDMAGAAAEYGAGFGLLPICWIILNIIFPYQLTKQKGYFKFLKGRIARVNDQRRLQLLLIACLLWRDFRTGRRFRDALCGLPPRC